MNQTAGSAIQNSQWQKVGKWPEAERPAALWSWLCDDGSLTRKLRALAGEAFHVQVLAESGIELEAEDAGLLGMQPGERVHVREVYLCGNQPLVFGRTVAPDHVAARWLEQLGAQPLGDRVFAGQDTTRSEIEIRQISTADALYRDAVRGLSAPPGLLWARRSVLSIQSARLLIYEVFLPGVGN